MKSDYEEIFEQRGQSYDLAMKRFPEARDQEFIRLFDLVRPDRFSTLLDVPSGGGYLRKFLPDTCDLVEFEPCEKFLQGQTHIITETGLEELILPGNRYDAIVCLAAIHHVKNKAHFLSQCYQALKPGGIFVLGDVNQTSLIAQFLDDFAGLHNGTGHQGYYLGRHEAASLAGNCGFVVTEVEEKPCPWVFDSQSAMLEFCRLLFGLQSVSDDTLIQQLEKFIGIKINPRSIELNWHLLYLTAVKQ